MVRYDILIRCRCNVIKCQTEYNIFYVYVLQSAHEKNRRANAHEVYIPLCIGAPILIAGRLYISVTCSLTNAYQSLVIDKPQMGESAIAIAIYSGPNT